MEALPDELLIRALSDVDGRGLARLECTSRRFASLHTLVTKQRPHDEAPEPEPEPDVAAAGGVRGLAELAAVLALSRRTDANLVVLRPDEKPSFALHVLESLLAAPARAAAGHCHSIVVTTTTSSASSASSASGASGAVTFGSGAQGQLGHSDDRTPLPQLLDVVHPTPRALRVGGADVCAVAAGTCHSVVSTIAGVFCFGDATGGRLGVGELLPDSGRYCPASLAIPGGWRERIVLVSAGSMHSACVSATGELWAWGDGSSCGMLGHGELNICCSPRRVEALASERIVALACGARSTAAITAAGSLFMCGRLPRQGVGDVAMGFDAPDDDHELDVHTPVVIAGLSGVKVLGVACGPSHYAAVSRCGKLFTWVRKLSLYSIGLNLELVTAAG